jgi:hypothetical protein
MTKMNRFQSTWKILTTDIGEVVSDKFSIDKSRDHIRLAINLFIAEILLRLFSFGLPIIYNIASSIGKIGLILLIYGVSLKIIERLSKLDLGKLAIPSSSLPDTLQSVQQNQIQKTHSSNSPELDSNKKEENTNQILLNYYVQVLRQSAISFSYSLIFAAIGFIVIVISIFPEVFQVPRDLTNRSNVQEETSASPSSSSESTSDKWPGLISGIVIEAISALIFVQTNNARKTMIEFSEKIRLDRRLDESLDLIDKIPDKKIQSKVKALLVLNFSGIVMKYDDREILQQIIETKNSDVDS